MCYCHIDIYPTVYLGYRKYSNKRPGRLYHTIPMVCQWKIVKIVAYCATAKTSEKSIIVLKSLFFKTLINSEAEHVRIQKL